MENYVDNFMDNFRTVSGTIFGIIFVMIFETIPGINLWNWKTIKVLFIETTVKCFQFELWRAKNEHMFSNWGSLIKFTVKLCSGLFIRFTCSLVIRAKCARCGKKSNLLLKPTSHWHRFFQESFVVGKPHPKVAKLKKVFHCCLHLKKVA